MTITTILCDLDGTLVDSRRDIAVAFQHAWQTVVGGTPPSAAAIAQHIGKPLAEMLSELGGLLSPPRLSIFLTTYRRIYAQQDACLTQLYPGVIATLQALSDLHARHRHHERTRASTDGLEEACPHRLLPAHPGWCPWSPPQTRSRHRPRGPRHFAVYTSAGPDGRRYTSRHPSGQGGWHQNLRRHLRLWQAGSACAVCTGLCDRLV